MIISTLAMLLGPYMYTFSSILKKMSVKMISRIVCEKCQMSIFRN